VADELCDALTPVLAAIGLDLFDVQVGPSSVVVWVDRAGGVDLDTLAEASRVVSGVLDDRQSQPGSYTLEVSSPGLERRLRTPRHFQAAVGEELSVRTVPGSDLRRFRGRLATADHVGIVVTGDDLPSGEVRLPYDQIERARTVFEWGSGPAPSPSGARKGGGAKGTSKKQTVDQERVSTR
jgi:ribosome maturation factor RimP